MEPEKQSCAKKIGCEGVLTGRGACLWNVLLSPVLLVYHCLSIYVFSCLGAMIRRFVVKVFCCLCESMCLKCMLFTDKDFPADDASLGKWRQENPGKKVIWVRAKDLKLKGEFENQELALFAGRIEPKDICQGALGDCWLMSALACMAEFPGLIRKVFITREESLFGKYSVRLFDGGTKQWITVTVDDYFPVNADSGEPVFTKPNGRELWVMVLEKAMAKFVGSYGGLDAGNEVWAWTAMTGSHVYGFKRTDNSWLKKNFAFQRETFRQRKIFVDMSKKEEKLSDDHFWHVLLLFDFRDAILSASISNDGEHQRPDGLVAGHAYSLLQVKEAGGFRLIQLRNPWGSFEWKGAWSDGNSLWTTHPNVAKALEYTQGDDGSFWMSYEDFLRTYNTVDVCDSDVNIRDLTLDRREDTGCFGIVGGCLVGVSKYWCCCEGCRFLYCGHVSSPDTPTGSSCCAPWMFVNEPVKKLRSWWRSRKTLAKHENPV
eukprot:c11219_g1_i1.p1 GENE.c11219_g1_i1~~c11219_g1_i1.p1  ORF type:complete len:487 (+),score=121.14 c11219_g1_i1:81-1541(+)